MGTKVYVQTQGCQMNEYDSAKMFDVLAEFEGAERVDDPAAADLLLLNTCSIREKAQEKVFSQLGQWRRFKAVVLVHLLAPAGNAGVESARRHPDGDQKGAPVADAGDDRGQRLRDQRGHGGHHAAHPGRGPGQRGEGELMGRTENNRVVNFPANERLVESFVGVRITEARPHSLRGAFLDVNDPWLVSAPRRERA